MTELSMKYTKQEQKKLDQLNAELAKARTKLRVLGKAKQVAGKKELIQFRNFRRARLRIETKLRQKERRLERAIDAAQKPATKAYWAQHYLIRRIRNKRYTLEAKPHARALAERRQKEIAAQRAPLNDTELALVKQRLIENRCRIYDGKTIVYKRVSADYKTQMGKSYETIYAIGSTVTMQNWNPRADECGSNKFHACYTPAQCNSYGVYGGYRYIAIEVKLNDLYAWPNYTSHPHKIAFRKGKVLYEVDQRGNKRANNSKAYNY